MTVVGSSMQNLPKILNDLIGSSLWDSTRAADLEMFSFGPQKTVTKFSGRSVVVGTHALHIQCAWRFLRNGTPVVASQDLCCPADKSRLEPLDAPPFDWEKEPNKRDQLLSALFVHGKKSFELLAIESAQAGQLRFEFDSGLTLDVFPTGSGSAEQWRLFETSDGGNYLVFNGNSPW